MTLYDSIEETPGMIRIMEAAERCFPSEPGEDDVWLINLDGFDWDTKKFKIQFTLYLDEDADPAKIGKFEDAIGMYGTEEFHDGRKMYHFVLAGTGK